MAASRPAAQRGRPVPGGVLGRAVADAAVGGPRHWPGAVCTRRAGDADPARQIPLAVARGGSRPARPWHRYPASPGHGAERYAGDAGPGGARAVAGAARAYAGLARQDTRRPAVATARHPRSLGAARTGRGAAVCHLVCRVGRARRADHGCVQLAGRAAAEQCPRRCLGDPAGLYRACADHSFRCQQGRRRCQSAAGAGRQHADRALQRRHARCRADRRHQ